VGSQYKKKRPRGHKGPGVPKAGPANSGGGGDEIHTAAKEKVIARCHRNLLVQESNDQKVPIRLLIKPEKKQN